MKKFRKTDPRQGQGRGDNYGCFRYMLVPILFILGLIALLMAGCTCMSQIPTQFYFVNDSCEYYLPDYTEAIEVRENCCIDTFYQTPEPGQKLIPGNDIIVRVVAIDCSGNTSSMQFDVITVDTIPPSFWYDSTAFIPIGMYQDSARSWLLYCKIDSSSFDSLMIAHQIWLYYRDHLYPELKDNWNDVDSLTYPTFQNPDYRKRTVFVATDSYVTNWLQIMMAKQGDPWDSIYFTLIELDENDQPMDTLLTQFYPAKFIETDDQDYCWYQMDFCGAIIQRGHKYCIEAQAPGTDANNKIIWLCNATRGDPNHYLYYIYNDSEDWGRNWNMAYMFNLFGRTLYNSH